MPTQSQPTALPKHTPTQPPTGGEAAHLPTYWIVAGHFVQASNAHAAKRYAKAFCGVRGSLSSLSARMAKPEEVAAFQAGERVKKEAGQTAQLPDYSERGPVWRVVPMDYLHEMATKPVKIWLVVDLDYNERDFTGYEMARCDKKSDAVFLARACNSHAALVAALERCHALFQQSPLNRDDNWVQSKLAVQARAALQLAKEGGAK